MFNEKVVVSDLLIQLRWDGSLCVCSAYTYGAEAWTGNSEKRPFCQRRFWKLMMTYEMSLHGINGLARNWIHKRNASAKDRKTRRNSKALGNVKLDSWPLFFRLDMEKDLKMFYFPGSLSPFTCYFITFFFFGTQ